MNAAEEKHFCLLIPCYNNYSGLLRSLKSVHYPSEKYLIVVVNDGSKELISETGIRNAVGITAGIVVIQNSVNKGITKALNQGLEWIHANVNCRFVARLDCGDICDPARFELQVAALSADPSLGLIGSWCRFQDANGEGYSYRTPTRHEDIEKEMYSRNVFIHPTVMFTASVAKALGNYPEGFEYAEDYAFFWEIIKVKKAYIIDKFLVVSEINKSGISFDNKSKQLAARWKVVKHCGSSVRLKLAGYLRLSVLFILPKRLTLQLKKWSG